MIYKYFKAIPAYFLLPLILTACQLAGSDKNKTDDKAEMKIGSFKDIPVSGLRYTIATETGITDSSGNFQYREGETIKFSFAGIDLGEAILASDEVSLSNLVPETKMYTTTSQVSELFEEPSSEESLGFTRFNNLITLLMSLDEDGNPDNGIQLSEKIERLIVDLKIKFRLDESIFDSENETQLKRIIQKAANQGLLQSGRLKNRGEALDEYYRILDLEHDLSIILEETENDYDGRIVHKISYSYDDYGRRLNISNQYFNNSELEDNISSYIYDEKGNLLSDGFSSGGQLKRLYSYEYDAYGNRVIYRNDSNGDGNIDSIVQLSYDELGQLLEVKLDTNVDVSSDNVAEIISTNTYDSWGNKLSYFYESGGIEQQAFYRYDSSNNLLEYKFDSTGDGEPNKIGIYAYDPKGNLITEKLDETGNNSFDEITYYTYSDKNKILTITHDFDGDEIDDQKLINVYDTLGKLLSSSRFNGDGYLNAHDSYVYDEQGNQLSFNHDSNGDGYTDYRFSSIYDLEGNRLLTEEDANGDDVVDTLISREYDDNNNLIRLVINTGSSDDQSTKIENFTYDEIDNLIAHYNDIDGDGSSEVSTNYTWGKTNWQALYRYFN